MINVVQSFWSRPAEKFQHYVNRWQQIEPLCVVSLNRKNAARRERRN
jgi:hypothetical protein